MLFLLILQKYSNINQNVQNCNGYREENLHFSFLKTLLSLGRNLDRMTSEEYFPITRNSSTSVWRHLSLEILLLFLRIKSINIPAKWRWLLRWSFFLEGNQLIGLFFPYHDTELMFLLFLLSGCYKDVFYCKWIDLLIITQTILQLCVYFKSFECYKYIEIVNKSFYSLCLKYPIYSLLSQTNV